MIKKGPLRCHPIPAMEPKFGTIGSVSADYDTQKVHDTKDSSHVGRV